MIGREADGQCVCLFVFSMHLIFYIFDRRSVVKTIGPCGLSWRLSRPMWMVLGQSRSLCVLSWVALRASAQCPCCIERRSPRTQPGHNCGRGRGEASDNTVACSCLRARSRSLWYWWNTPRRPLLGRLHQASAAAQSPPWTEWFLTPAKRPCDYLADLSLRC